MDINKIAINKDGCVLQNINIYKMLKNVIDFPICNIANISNIENKNVFFAIVVS